jgi:tRNA(Ile)-lysidine synthase
MLHLDTTPLQGRKNLLAFSAGIDSSALFFLLIEQKISFDIAIVNYNQRPQSQEELHHAKALAKAHKRFCHHIDAPPFKSNFEAKARDFRYQFFESLIQIEGYDNLITAHQLDDQLEWFLMRLSRGAGLFELVGLQPITQKEGYTLVRPLLSHTKASLLAYLKAHHHPYFFDESNLDPRHERNRFRNAFSAPLMEQYAQGIARSFAYLSHDKSLIEESFEVTLQHHHLTIITLHHPKSRMRAIDVHLKRKGYLLSASQRHDIGSSNSLVIGGKWAIEIVANRVYIAPYISTPMPKAFKEACRHAKIPIKIRPYLFEIKIDPSTLP